MTARLIRWIGPMVNPGTRAKFTPTDQNVRVRYTAEFDKPAAPDEVYNLQQCPKYFDVYTFDGTRYDYLFVVDVEISQDANVPQASTVDVTYANKWTNQQNADRPDIDFTFVKNPLLRPALITWGTYVSNETVELAYPTDDAGEDTSNARWPVTTSAGEPLLITEEKHNRLLRINKNVRQVPDIFAEGSNYINEEATKIGGYTFKKYTLWLADIEIGNISNENGFIYFPIQLLILHNPKTWIRKLRNAGYYMKAVNSKQRQLPNGQWEQYYPIIPVVFSGGRKADSPVLLNKTTSHPLQMVITSADQDPFIPNRIERQYDIKAPDDFGRTFTEEELKSTVLSFRTKDKLNFTRTLSSVLR